MPIVRFRDSLRFRFTCSLIESATRILNFNINSEKETIDIKDIRIARLFERLNDMKPAILIYPGSQKDHWLVTGNHEAILDRTISRLVRFLIPSYGYFTTEGALRYSYNPEASEVQKCGASLYSAGYYRWESPSEYRDEILDRLMLWLDLDAGQPDIHASPIKSYYQLHSEFEEALSKEHWDLASQCLAEIQNLHLSTAENLTFLQLQLWANQGHWNKIWENPDYPIWAQLSMPRSVRTLLLTAFHSQELEALESQNYLREAILAFKENRPRLGMLLTGPFEFEKAPVARVVAYQSVADINYQRLSFLKTVDLDLKTKQLLENLAQFLNEPIATPTTSDDPVNEVRHLLIDKDYAQAEEVINKVKDTTVQTLLMIELAFHAKDNKFKDKAWQLYQSLTFEEQEALSGNEYFVETYLQNIKDYALPTETTEFLPLHKTDVWAKNISEARDLAWKDICNLESRIRALIVIRLENQYGENWLSRISPEKIARWEEMREKDQSTFKDYEHGKSKLPLLDYSYLGDLLEIINRYWNLFADVFGGDKHSKRELQNKLQAIIRIRNPLAHNREVPGNELKRANVYCTDLMMMLDRFD
jgi:hypothetical protein